MFLDRGNSWLRFRLAILPWMFFCGILAGANYASMPASAKPSLLFIAAFGGIALLLMPILIVPVIAFQAINPLSDRKWSPPRHDENPFRLGNPLRALHFVSFQLPVMGLGMIVSSLWLGYEVLLVGALQVLGGASIYAGMLLSEKVVQHKMCDSAERLE